MEMSNYSHDLAATVAGAALLGAGCASVAPATEPFTFVDHQINRCPKQATGQPENGHCGAHIRPGLGRFQARGGSFSGNAAAGKRHPVSPKRTNVVAGDSEEPRS